MRIELFAGDLYYPEGGYCDYKGSFSNQAKALSRGLEYCSNSGSDKWFMVMVDGKVRYMFHRFQYDCPLPIDITDEDTNVAVWTDEAKDIYVWKKYNEIHNE